MNELQPDESILGLVFMMKLSYQNVPTVKIAVLIQRRVVSVDLPLDW